VLKPFWLKLRFKPPGSQVLAPHPLAGRLLFAMAVLSRACLAAASASLALLLHGCGSPPPPSSPTPPPPLSSDCALPALSLKNNALPALIEEINRDPLLTKFADGTMTLKVGLRGDAAKDAGCCGALRTATKEAPGALPTATSTEKEAMMSAGQAALLACRGKEDSSMGASVEMTVAAEGKSVGPGACEIPSAVLTRLQQMAQEKADKAGGPAMAGRNITLQSATVKGLSDACCSKATNMMTKLAGGGNPTKESSDELMECWPDTFSFSASANLAGGSGFAAVAETLQRQTLSFLSMMHVPEKNTPTFVM